MFPLRLLKEYVLGSVIAIESSSFDVQGWPGTLLLIRKQVTEEHHGGWSRDRRPLPPRPGICKDQTSSVHTNIQLLKFTQRALRPAGVSSPLLRLGMR